jgi:hypothetical protein
MRSNTELLITNRNEDDRIMTTHREDDPLCDSDVAAFEARADAAAKLKANREQFIKELPNGEIELHGETKTHQFHPSQITAMQIRYEDGKILRIIRDEEVEPYWALIVISGRSSEYPSEDRIVFTASTEGEVEKIREEINNIRYKKNGKKSGLFYWISAKARREL